MSKDKIDDLREKAKKILEQQPIETAEEKKFQYDISKLLEEISVYQIELEIQNEQLRSVEAELKREKLKFSDLYHNAPVGYLLLNNRGHIIESNNKAAEMLANEHPEIKNQPFIVFLERESYSVFYTHLRQIFEEKMPDAEAELKVKNKIGAPRYLHLKSNFLFDSDKDEQWCRTIIEDITTSKRDKTQLEDRLQTLTQPEVETEQLEITDLFSIKRLQELQDSFANAFGIPSLIFNSKGKAITKPSCFSELCSYIRSLPKGRLKCESFDAQISDTLTNTPKTIIRNGCVLNNMVMGSVPIIVRGQFIAHFSIGQFRTKTIDKEELNHFANKIDADVGKLNKAAEKAPLISEEKFHKAIGFLKVMAKQIGQLGFHNWQQARFIEKQKRQENRLKYAIEKVEQSEERFRAIFKQDHAIKLLINPDTGQVIDANIAAEKFYGYSLDRLKSLFIQDINVLSSAEVAAEMRKAREHHRNYFLFKHRIANGEIRDVEVYSTPIEYQGQTQLFSIIHDITERTKAQKAIKASNEKQEKILNALDDGVYLSSADYDILYLNPRMEQQIGYNAAGEKCYTAIYGLETPCANCYFEKLKQTGGKISTHVKLKGRYYTITSVLLDNNSKLSVYHDITDIKHTENELQEKNRNLIKAKKQAEESDRLKTAFLNNISHEVRTPMNGIVGFAEILNKSHLSPEKQKYYTSLITQSVEQLLQIVTDIVTVSKIQTNQEQLFEKEINLNDLMTEIYHIYLPLTEKNTQVKIDMAAGFDDNNAQVVTDRGKLQTILNCLINNAIKFTDSGSIKFGYKPDNQQLQFFVSDTGIGIAPADHEKIFEQFWQTEKGFSRQYGGTGLGLTIAKKYVEMLGGKIWLESELQKGTTFYFTIPYQTNKQKVYAEPQNKPESHWENRTILVAEDEAINFAYLEEILLEKGAKVLHASNGAEAVNLCNEQNVDLVLMDLKMPVMDGYEASRRIKASCPDIPIVVQTAYAFPEDEERILQIGCNDMVTKPITKRQLEKIIERNLPDK